ncbi:hypothetical protein P8452_38978 [Trifolium repens]|nr:hypothetical protein P8452_38978 [Trifolium repens]
MAHRQAAADNGSGKFKVRALIRLLPVVLILLPNYPYEHRLTTPKGVNYYVKSTKFERDYPLDSRKRVTIEERVEREYFGIFRQNCQIELQRRQLGYIRETPHCDMLRIFDLVR